MCGVAQLHQENIVELGDVSSRFRTSSKLFMYIIIHSPKSQNKEVQRGFSLI